MKEIIELGEKIVNCELSFEDFIKALEFINMQLRGKVKPDEEIGIYQGDMIVEGLVSPSNDMQINILKKLYDTLHKNIDSNAKGMICYYTLNNLHLFEDGNGRTSRFFYQLFTSNYNEDYLYHPDSKEDLSKRTDFEQENGLSSVEKFLNTVNYNLLLNKLSDGSIYDCERMHEYNRISTYPVDLYANEHFKTTFLSNDVVKELGEEAKEVSRNISNRNCSFSIAGLAMCELLTKSGQLEHFIELNDKHFSEVSEEYKTSTKGNLLFYIGSNGEFISDVNTEKWDAQTCREYLSISEKLLLEQYDMIVEASKYYAKKKKETVQTQEPALK
jgi:hypothetical protein